MPYRTLTQIHLLTLLLLLNFAIGCTGTVKHDNVVITNSKDLDKYVGNTVVLRGELERTKLPSVLGVDMSYNDIPTEDMFGKQVECRGKLQREVNKNTLPHTQRGGITYYHLVDISDDEPITVKIIE